MGRQTPEQAVENMERAGAQFSAAHAAMLDACGEDPRDEARIAQLRTEAARAYETWRAASFYVVFGRTP